MQNLVDKRIKPWVNKKIFEYIGEQEPTLVEFICSKVSCHDIFQFLYFDSLISTPTSNRVSIHNRGFESDPGMFMGTYPTFIRANIC